MGHHRTRKDRQSFSEDLLLSERAILLGVASRDERKAKAFAKKYRAINAYRAYEDLIQDPLVDVIYIATPHSLHHSLTLECLKDGKGVLCEKPMGLKGSEVEEMIQMARDKKVFLMEALWTRFIPATEELISLLKEESIGKLNTLKADFGFKVKRDHKGRLFKKELGGGSLMDVGIYPLYLSLISLGYPKKVSATAKLNDNGIDLECEMNLEYENGATAQLQCSFLKETPTEVYFIGDKGSLILHSRFHHSKKISLFKNQRLQNALRIPYEGHGYIYEIEEVNDCISSGEIESEKMPLDLSMRLIKLIDEVKTEIGLSY